MANLQIIRLDSKLNKIGKYLWNTGGKYLIFPLPFKEPRHPSEAVATCDNVEQIKNYLNDYSRR